jgi:hypothetical protein
VRALPEVESCATVDAGYELQLREGADAAGAIPRIAAAIRVGRIEVKRPRLEDVFVQLVAGEARSPDDARTLRAELAGTVQVSA